MASLISSIRSPYLKLKALLVDLYEDNSTLTALESRINSNPGLPVSNPTTSFWTLNPPFPDLINARSKTLPGTTDIVIIGSGITGASVARTILSECASSITTRLFTPMLAREVCNGATGRNGGHIKCAPFESFHEYKKRFGVERARVLTDFQVAHLPLLVELAKEENWDLAEARKVETLDVFYDEEPWLEWKEMVEEFRQDVPEKANDIFVWEKDVAREV